MKRAVLALMVVTAMTAPVYADDETDFHLAELISSSARFGVGIGVECALESARDIAIGLSPEDADKRMWECIRVTLDENSLGPDTAIHLVEESRQ